MSFLELLLAVFKLVLFTIVIRDLPVHYYAFCAIQTAHFVIMLVSLGSQNERYNEVTVYFLLLAFTTYKVT